LQCIFLRWLWHLSLGFSRLSFFPGWGYWPYAQSPVWRTRLWYRHVLPWAFWQMPEEHSVSPHCGAHFVRLLCWDLASLGDPTIAFVTTGTAPSFIGACNSSCPGRVTAVQYSKLAMVLAPYNLQSWNAVRQCILQYIRLFYLKTTMHIYLSSFLLVVTKNHYKQAC